MERLGQGLKSGVVLLDAGVVRDVASSLNGLWNPGEEHDAERRAQMVAAARLRVYADRDLRGWYLATTPTAHAKAIDRGDAEWSVGFIRDVSTFEGCPPRADVVGLEEVLRAEGIDAEAADCLAYAMLFDEVMYVVTRAPRELRHTREHDLPERLEILDPVEAVERLALAPGEPPLVGPPEDSLLAEGEPWWVP